MAGEKHFEFKNKEALKCQKLEINEQDRISLADDELILRVMVNKVYMKMTGGQERYTKEELFGFRMQQEANHNFNDHVKAIEEDSTRLKNISFAYITFAGAGYLEINQENPTDVAVAHVTELFDKAYTKSKTEWIKNKLDMVYQDMNATLTSASKSVLSIGVASYATGILEKERRARQDEKDADARNTSFFDDVLKMI